MGCFGSKESPKKVNKLETSSEGNERPKKELSLRKQISQKKLAKEPSLAKQSSLRKDSSQQEVGLKNEKPKDETSVVSSPPPTEAKEVEETREDVNIVINENFDWGDAQDTRTESEMNGEGPRTPTPSPSPSLRKKSPVPQLRGQRRLSEGNAARGSSLRKILNAALNRPTSMSQSLDVTSVPTLSSRLSQDKDEPLTKAMMLEWKTPNVGFERLLATKAGRILFDNFLRKEYSSENLQFWIACEKLKSITEENFTNHVDVIFKIYIDPTALDEISLEGRVKTSLRKKKENPTRDIFEEAQTKIYSLMHRDSFPRFLISKDYKDALLQFGPISHPDSPSSVGEEPKFPRSSELEGQLTEATKSLLENVQTPEMDDQQGESFDNDPQPEEVEKCIISGTEEQKEIEKGFSDVKWQLVHKNV